MDSTAFDRLARSLAAAPSRRSVLRGLVAAAAGAGVLTAAQPAEAACRKVGDDRGCRNDDQCCNNARCRNRKCTCKPGYKNCDGKCVDLGSDEDNCGRCGRKCGKNETCVKDDGDKDDEARCRRNDGDGDCAAVGQRCNDRKCCAGGRCLAGNDGFLFCTPAS